MKNLLDIIIGFSAWGIILLLFVFIWNPSWLIAKSFLTFFFCFFFLKAVRRVTEEN